MKKVEIIKVNGEYQVQLSGMGTKYSVIIGKSLDRAQEVAGQYLKKYKEAGIATRYVIDCRG